MRRVIVFDEQDGYLFDIPPADVLARTRVEEVNGEHSMSITTTRALKKGMRILTRDETGTWREHVVVGEDQSHADGMRPFGTYYCVWSLQYDLQGVPCSRMPGTRVAVTATEALDAALSGTARWSVGTVTQGSVGGASMYQMSAWEALGVLVQVWGGEVDASIEVGASGVTARRVSLYMRQGSATVTRRFDYGRDVTGVNRKVSDERAFARIIPLGKGEEVGGGYGRRITISDVNNGVEWLQNDEMAEVLKVPDGAGGWEYPQTYAVFEDADTPEKLLDAGLAALEEYTVPQVSYTLNVLQLAEVGADAKAVALGDSVDVVDKAFYGGLRLTTRVLRIETDELNPADATVTLSTLPASIADSFSSISRGMASLDDRVSSTSYTMAEYFSDILGNINRAINDDDGWVYCVPGRGVVTYDAEVSDPFVGDEATQVTELRGGTLRFADSRTATGEWDWRTVIVSGHIAAEMVTAVNVRAGTVGSADGGILIDLDTGTFYLGGRSLAGAVDEINGSISQTNAAVSALQLQNKGFTDTITTLTELGDNVESWFSFRDEDGGEPTMEIGTSASTMRMRLSNHRQDFMDGATAVLSLIGETSTAMADNLQARSTLRVGNYKVAETNGGDNLTWTYVGEV